MPSIATARMTVVWEILAVLFFAMVTPPVHGQGHSLTLTNVADGVAQLQFSAPTGFFSRLEVTSDLLRPFDAASGWFFGSGQIIQTPVYLLGTPVAPADRSETFTVYPFTNGLSLIVGTNSGALPMIGLVNLNYHSLPPLHIQPGTDGQEQLILRRGSLAWNGGYSAYDVNTVPPNVRVVLERLTTRYAEVTNTLARHDVPGWSRFGSGLFLPGSEFFFRIARFPADEDNDGLDWASESFLTATDPQLPDSDQDGTLDGIEDLDFDHIPNADEIQFDLNPRFDDSGQSGLSQIFAYDGLHRLRRIVVSGTVVWQATLDRQGNITRIGQ